MPLFIATRYAKQCNIRMVRDRDGNVDQFLGERIERPGSHDLLECLPRSASADRIVRDRLPEIVDPVGLARGHDVVVDGADFGGGVGVFDKANMDMRFSKRCQVLGLRSQERPRTLRHHSSRIPGDPTPAI